MAPVIQIPAQDIVDILLQKPDRFPRPAHTAPSLTQAKWELQQRGFQDWQIEAFDEAFGDALVLKLLQFAGTQNDTAVRQAILGAQINDDMPLGLEFDHPQGHAILPPAFIEDLEATLIGALQFAESCTPLALQAAPTPDKRRQLIRAL